MQSDRQEEMARRVEEERRKASEARIRFRNLQVQSVSYITANLTENHETFPIQMYAITVYNSVTSGAPSTDLIVYCALLFFHLRPQQENQFSLGEQRAFSLVYDAICSFLLLHFYSSSKFFLHAFRILYIWIGFFKTILSCQEKRSEATNSPQSRTDQSIKYEAGFVLSSFDQGNICGFVSTA